MPPLETMDRNQTAVLWALAGRDAYNVATVSAPVEIRVRWNNKRREAVGPTGTPIATDAGAITARTVAVGSIFWLGTLEGIPGTSEVPTADLFEVVAIDTTLDIKGRFVRRELLLSRYNDTLPEVV